jgi:hypothetical protein
MRQFKLTAITLGLLSATALPALAGPMGHAHIGGGEAAEAIATSTSAQATAAKTIVGLNHGGALNGQMGQGKAKNAVSAVQSKAQVAKQTAQGNATETISAAKTKLESSKGPSQSLANVNPAKVKQDVGATAKSAAQSKAKVANGTTKSRLESQENFVKSLADVNAGPTIPTTSGKAEQSVAKAKAVQTQTGIAVDSLAIANSNKANNTELFR